MSFYKKPFWYLPKITMLYWIQCKIQIRVFGISGPFEDTITQMVNANTPHEAKTKFENHIRRKFDHMKGESYSFQYIIVADTI